MANQGTETASLGEGFAFFCWHRLIFNNSCRGINDRRPGYGRDGCAMLWRSGNRD